MFYTALYELIGSNFTITFEISMPLPTILIATVPVDIMSVMYFINTLFKTATLRIPRLPGSLYVFVKLLILGIGFESTVSDGYHCLKKIHVTTRSMQSYNKIH